MAARTNFDNRMKSYEDFNKTHLTFGVPVAIRIDGRAFHTFTKNFQKPYDSIFVESMQTTMKYLCENIQGCVFGYTCSDEITLILADYLSEDNSTWFGYKIQKICSVSASMATMVFNKIFYKEIMQLESDIAQEYEMCGETDWVKKMEQYLKAYSKSCDKGATFDSRCFNIPVEEVCNLIYWRQCNAKTNSINILARTIFPHRELQRKKETEVLEMVSERGFPWESYRKDYRLGSCCIKEDGQWVIDYDIPEFLGENRQYVERHITAKESKYDDTE